MRTNTRAINIFGSKVLAAKNYPSPKYDIVVEPFAGGAGYSLLYSERSVMLGDVDPNITKLWEYLIEASPEEVLKLPLIQPRQDVSTLECSEGGRLLISWCLNQTAKPQKRLSSWGEYHLQKGAACYWGPKRREQAAEIAGRINHWTIFLRSYKDWPDIEATWFIDPVYLGSKAYAYSDMDYTELADWCRSRRGQVIVCEQVGATWLPFRPLCEIPTQKRFQGGASQRAKEAIWTNEMDDVP